LVLINIFLFGLMLASADRKFENWFHAIGTDDRTKVREWGPLCYGV
jgi:hypothetical protein